MTFGIYNWRTFYVIFWGVQSLIILLGAHLILWHGEPEGFFEIYTVKYFLPQYLIHVAAFFILVLVLDRIHRIEFVKGGKAWLVPRNYAFYTLKTIVLPLSVAIPFAYLYFSWFGVSLDFKTYMQRVFPFFFMFVLLLNLIVLIRYVLLRMAWLVYGRKGDEQAVTRHKSATEEQEDMYYASGNLETEDRKIDFFRDWIKLDAPLGRVAYCCIENRSTMIYLADGRSGRFSGTLTDLRNFIGDDPRFFATGRWVVNGQYIERIEDSFSRTKYVALKFPFQAKFSLSKEKVSEFKQWFDKVKEQRSGS